MFTLIAIISTVIYYLAAMRARFLFRQRSISPRSFGISNMFFAPGKDGVIGEAVDPIICLLVLIYTHNPTINEDDLVKIVERKCLKWKQDYATINYNKIERDIQNEHT